MAEKGKRGFAAMDRDKQRAIASKGGRAAHQKGTAHEFTPEEAREAGRKGGQAAHEKGKAHRFTPEEAREAGRKGGQAARQKSEPVEVNEPEPIAELNGMSAPEVMVEDQAVNGQPYEGSVGNPVR